MEWISLNNGGKMNGKIICVNAAIHKVLLENNTIIDTKVRGKLRNDKVHPVVGDNVVVNTQTKTISNRNAIPFFFWYCNSIKGNNGKLLVVVIYN